MRPIELLPRVDGVDEPISSTAIRRALAGGDVTRAASMLGRQHEVRGTVVMGDQRGRLLGFPTANVAVPNTTCMPADGVYSGWYERPNGDVSPCAINIGRRPTFYEHADSSLLEAHLIDFSGDLYGEQAEVRFAHFLRSERKFDGIEAIVAQLTIDVQHRAACSSPPTSPDSRDQQPSTSGVTPARSPVARRRRLPRSRPRPRQRRAPGVAL